MQDKKKKHKNVDFTVSILVKLAEMCSKMESHLKITYELNNEF